jgi:hypothetical protein
MKIVCNPEDVNIDLVEEGNAPQRCGCRGTCGRDYSRAVGYFHDAGLLQVLEKIITSLILKLVIIILM